MNNVSVHLKDNQTSYTTGDVILGTVGAILPRDVPLSNVNISFNCIGEVKWCEYPHSIHYLDGRINNENVSYYQDILAFSEKDITATPHNDHKNVLIPFSFTIPKDKHLPSSMVSPDGFIQYNIVVTVKGQEKINNFVKEVIVQSPMEKNLMITVSGSAEKTVLLHAGKVLMHASIGRKGFAPGEKISVHLSVDNQTNTVVMPRIILYQVQLYMSGVRHKSIESILTEEPVIGQEIGPHMQVQELLELKIPSDEALTIKSSIITVKYFVNVTLDIPNSFDLHINLPLVLTSRKVIEKLCEKGDSNHID